MNELILDDELISDYEFELRIHDITFTGRAEEFKSNKSPIYSDVF